jgi:hypothetical protein
MVELYGVTYWESAECMHSSHKYFYLTQKRDASNLARVMSKKSGRRSQIWKCRGYYDSSYSFCEIEASNVAIYDNGKKR